MDWKLARILKIRDDRGLTLLETLIAAFILLFVLLSMISAYTLGRINIDREEVKRKAIAVAQDRLEDVRARYAVQPGDKGWYRIVPARIDTSYTVDRQSFTVTSRIDSTDYRKTIYLTVSWTARKNSGAPVTRTIKATTDIAKVIPET